LTPVTKNTVAGQRRCTSCPTDGAGELELVKKEVRADRCIHVAELYRFL
jgi:hypothetical protein